MILLIEPWQKRAAAISGFLPNCAFVSTGIHIWWAHGETTSYLVVIRTRTFLRSYCTRALEITLPPSSEHRNLSRLASPTSDLKTTFFNVQLSRGTAVGDNGKIEAIPLYRTEVSGIITILWKFNRTGISPHRRMIFSFPNKNSLGRENNEESVKL